MARTMQVIILFFALVLVSAKKKVSLQWAICDPSPQHTLVKLGLDAATPPYKENPITYYDEHPPIYISSGLMFRTKTNKGQPLSTVKVGFDEETSDIPDFVECTWNTYGDNRPTYTCEKRCPLNQISPGDLWCGEQVQFAQRYGHVDWASLRAYGPYQNAKWKVRIEGHKAKFDDVVAGGLHLMEIETKVPTARADEVIEATTRYLRDRGVVLCDPQEGKTKRLFRAMGYEGIEEDEL
ncbi:hypothetical protein QQS21_004496 [Conoideocrella luteorostrata]|uniref:Uncharacterized protein n=1 Tax=Conoideocrella luteorostrata TaxID=1105319 RepID=A0AAJ0FZS7_9HYPO|nr:hypothetical protein QQS21_004496 [Conoideocrella luteorostrata]